MKDEFYNNNKDKIIEYANRYTLILGLMHDMGHSINNLGGLYNALYTLLPKNVTKNHKANELLSSYNKEFEKIRSIIQTIRNQARDSSSFVTVGFRELFSEVLPLLGNRINRCKLEFEHDDLPETFTIKCIKSELIQAFFNILTNSLESIAKSSMRNNGKIKIVATIEGNKNLKISIKDNGLGIDKANLKDIFNYYSLKNYPIVGFGLMVSKRIIEEHHSGTISINSEIGEYTEVIITIPN